MIGREMNKTGYEITCSEKKISKIRIIARSRTAGIWRIKRAKIILGHLEGKTIDRLVLDVRVPPETIKKCLKSFASNGLKFLLFLNNQHIQDQRNGINWWFITLVMYFPLNK